MTIYVNHPVKRVRYWWNHPDTDKFGILFIGGLILALVIFVLILGAFA